MSTRKTQILYTTCVTLLVVSCVLLVLAFCLESFNNIIGFNGYAADGAFQLMNPMTRLAHGWVLGKDFNFFHGPGVALIHYPLFLLFGQGLFGSEMSRWLTSILLFVSTTLLIVWAFFKSKKYSFGKVALAFGCIFLFSALFVDVVTPTNSLLGVRTTFPVLVAALMLSRKLIPKKLQINRLSIGVYELLLGLGLSLSVLCGTEQGIAALGAYISVEIIRHAIATRPKTMKAFGKYILTLLRSIALPLGFTAIWLLSLAAIISLGHPIKLLAYNLITVPGDQFWYFGAEPQGYLAWHSIWQQLATPSIIPLYVGTAVTTALLVLAKRQKLFTRYEWYAIGFLLLYGLITLSTMIGYYSPSGQIVAALRVFVIVSSLIVATLVTVNLRNTSYKKYALAVIYSGIITGIIVLSVATVSPLRVKILLKDTWHNIQGDHSTLLGPAWTEWTNKFDPYIATAKHDSAYPLWSTYASVYERQNNLIQPSSGGYDYIIHALGNGRDQYTHDFMKDKPELVITLRPSYFGFEEWLWGRNADFYQQLVENYTIVSENDAHILWKRSSPLPTDSSYPLAINGTDIALPSATQAGSQLIKVTVHYSTHSLPGLKKIPRYIIKPSGAVSTIGFSMPPNDTSWSFLVVLKKGATPAKLQSYADGLIPGASLSVSSASYQTLPIGEKEIGYFTEKSIFLK